LVKRRKKTVKIGIVGASGICQVSHIPNLKLDQRVELTAICDSDPGRASVVANRYDVPVWYEQAERMFRDEELDGVIISTPTIAHLPLCQIAFESGVDVMIEKPFARDAKEAQTIVDTARKNKRILMVAMNHRFRDDTLMLKEIMDQGDLGELSSVRSGWIKRLGLWSRPNWFTDQRLSGGGVLMDLGIQMIDIILFLLNFPQVIESHCGTSNKILGLDVEDNASCFIRFDNGSIFLLEVGWANCDVKDVAFTFISCSQGGAFLNPLRITRRQQDKIISLHDQVSRDEIKLYKQSFSRELDHFIECVKDRKEPLSTGQEAVSVMKVIDKLYESSGR